MKFLAREGMGSYMGYDIFILMFASCTYTAR